MSERRLSKNMQRQVERRERHKKFLEENQERLMALHGWPASKFEQVKTRVRRGKVVEIPEVWQGMVTHDQTKRKRNEVKRRTRKNKNRST